MPETQPGLDFELGVTLNKLSRQVAQAEARMQRMVDRVERQTRGLGDRGFNNLPRAARRAAQQVEAEMTSLQRRINGSLGGLSGLSASESASAFRALEAQRRGVDQLQASLDPLFAAQQRLAAGTTQLEAAVESGVITDQQAAQVKRLLTAQYELSTRALNQNAASATTAAASQARFLNISSGGRFVLQNTAAQIGDIAVQLEAGTAATRVASQQLPQLFGGLSALGGTLGIVGPILGTIAAVAIPAAAALLTFGNNAEEAEEEVQSFADRLDTARASLERAEQAMLTASANGLEEVRDRYSEITDEVVELVDALADLERSNAQQDVVSAISAVLPGFEEITNGQIRRGLIDLERLQSRFVEVQGLLQSPQARSQSEFANLDAELNSLQQVFRGVSEVREAVEILSDELDLLPTEAETLVVAFARVREQLQAENFEGAVQAIRDMRDEAEELGFETDSEFVGALLQAEDLARRLVGGVSDVKTEVTSAADEADRLSSNLQGALSGLRGVLNGIQTANRRGLNQALIRQQTIGDPVARAEGFAREDFNEETGAAAFELARTGNTGQLASLADAANRVAADAGNIAAIEEAIREAESEFNNAREAAQNAQEETPFFQGVEQQITALERQIEVVGRSQSEVAALRTEWGLLDLAQERGVEINDELRNAIRRQAEEVGRLTEALSEAELRQQTLEQIADQIAGNVTDAFVDAITGAESFGDAFRNMAASILADLGRLIIQQTLYNAIAGALGVPTQPTLLGTFFPNTFETGGFTGVGGRREPAGIVHRGEYVLNQDATRRIGVANLDALNEGRQLPGFESGGLVGGSIVQMPNTSVVSRSQSTPQVNVAAPNVEPRIIIVNDEERIPEAMYQSSRFRREVARVVRLTSG